MSNIENVCTRQIHVVEMRYMAVSMHAKDESEIRTVVI